MNRYKLIFTLISIILILSACRKDSTTTELDRFDPDIQINFETTVEGYVADVDGDPIENATVSILNNDTKTDEYGFFKIFGLLGENHGVVSIQKDGYFNQVKTIIPSKNSINRIVVRLIEKENGGSIIGSEGGEIIIQGESKIQFQPNSFINSSGESYTDKVIVTYFYVDPLDPELDMNMPGNLMARDNDDELNILQSFGMVNIEIEGNFGERLEITKPATLTMEIPQSLLANAPNEIPLWYFDENSGYWIEEGSALLDNGSYVGNVHHFTFWNCDVPSRFFTLLKGQIVNAGDSPLMKVRITNVSNGQSYADWTDENGNFDGYVPKNEELLLEVMENCGVEVIQSELIGPFLDDVTEFVEVDVTYNPDLIVIEGILVSCSGEAISKGKVFIEVENSLFNQVVETASDGSFITTISNCSNPVLKLTLIDFDNKVLSDPIEYSMTSSQNLGSIEVCPATNSVIIEYNGQTKIIAGCSLQVFDDLNSTSYTFTFFDYFNEDAIEPIRYEWRMSDSNKDIANPNWTIMGGSIWARPKPGIDYVEAFGPLLAFWHDSELLQNATIPGEILSLRFADVKIEVRMYDQEGFYTNSYFENSTVTFNGTLE